MKPPPNVYCNHLPLIFTMQSNDSILCDVIVQPNSPDMPMPFEVVPQDIDFGVLSVSSDSPNAPSSTGVCIHLSIDSSASMMDACGDGMTQMFHIKNMLRNFMNILKQNSSEGRNILVQIQTFDDRVQIQLPLVDLRSVSIEDIEGIIESIQPLGATNLGAALESNTELFNGISDIENKYTFLHIVMTDGYVTSGIQDVNQLRQLIPTTCPTTIIGCGLGHDVKLMYSLGSGSGNIHHKYRAVNTFNQSGMVCGDVLNVVLNMTHTDVRVSCDGCEIYDHITNTWITDMDIGCLTQSTPRQFHIRGPHLLLTGRIIATGIFIEAGQTFSKPAAFVSIMADLRNYNWRQRVQELLYDTRQCVLSNRMREHSAEIRLNLETTFRSLRTFIDENDLHDSSFYNALCDDLYIAHRCTSDMDIERARIFTVSRGLTQGDQDAFAMNYDRGQELNTGGRNWGGTDDAATQIDYIPTPTTVFSTPYATQQAVTMMRNVSSGAPPI
jgi:uncharacterized protein YegL